MSTGSGEEVTKGARTPGQLGRGGGGGGEEGQGVAPGFSCGVRTFLEGGGRQSFLS